VRSPNRQEPSNRDFTSSYTLGISHFLWQVFPQLLWGGGGTPRHGRIILRALHVPEIETPRGSLAEVMGEQVTAGRRQVVAGDGVFDGLEPWGAEVQLLKE
jgi:hypothetical protein